MSRCVPETAKAVDSDGWLHTRDMGFLRADGCLRFLGRCKDMLRVGGENVDPMEIEALIMEDPRVHSAAVVRLADARLSEVPVAFVVPRSGHAITQPEVIDLCRGRIASFKIPRHVFFVDALPMTGSGKVQKYLLRHEAEQRTAELVSAATP
jgi:fatty-acyl-CoA synthase